MIQQQQQQQQNSTTTSTNPVNNKQNDSNEQLTGLEVKGSRNSKQQPNQNSITNNNTVGNNGSFQPSISSMKIRKETTLPTISIAASIQELAQKEQQNMSHLANYHLNAITNQSNNKSQQQSLNLASTNNNNEKIKEINLNELAGSGLVIGRRRAANNASVEFDSKEYKALKASVPKMIQFQSPSANNNNNVINNSNTAGLKLSDSLNYTNPNKLNKGKLVSLKQPIIIYPNISYVSNYSKNLNRQKTFASYYAYLIEQEKTRQSFFEDQLKQQKGDILVEEDENQEFDENTDLVKNVKKMVEFSSLNATDLNEISFIKEFGNSKNKEDLDKNSGDEEDEKEFNFVHKKDSKLEKASPKLLILRLRKNQIKSEEKLAKETKAMRKKEGSAHSKRTFESRVSEKSDRSYLNTEYSSKRSNKRDIRSLYDETF